MRSQVQCRSIKFVYPQVFSLNFLLKKLFY